MTDYRKRLGLPLKEKIIGMFRFNSSQRFRYWFIDVDGATITTQHGVMSGDPYKVYGATDMDEGGTVNRTVWPTSEKARAEAEKRVAKQQAKGYQEYSELDTFKIRPYQPKPKKAESEAQPYKLAEPVSDASMMKFDWLHVPPPSGYWYRTPPSWDERIACLGNLAPENVLAGNLSAAQVKTLAPVIYTYDAERLALTVHNLQGAVRPLVDDIVADYQRPDLPTETPWWLDATADFTDRRKLPDDLGARHFPPIVVGEHSLSGLQRMSFLRAVMFHGSTSKLFQAVVQRLASGSKERLGIAALRLWFASPGTKAYRGLLDLAAEITPSMTIDTLRKMAPLWQKDYSHRAATATATLLRMDTPDSMAAVKNLFEKHPNRIIRDLEETAWHALATKRGVSLDDLFDMFISTCGLDSHGATTFSYGPRAFQAVLTAGSELHIRQLDDGQPVGPTMKSLPKSTTHDDEDLVQQALAEFNELRKVVRKLVKLQLQRYERFILAGRSWDGAHFEQNIARHPVLGRILGGLVWQIDYSDGSQATARIDQLGMLDTHDELVSLDEARVWLPHPKDLTAQEIAQWNANLLDYEITPPFPQLNRRVFELADGNRNDIELHGLPDDEVSANHVWRFLQNFGWVSCPGYADDEDEYVDYLTLPERGVQLVMTTSGGNPHNPSYAFLPTQITRMTVHRWDGTPPEQLSYANKHAIPRGEAIPWGDAPASLASEVRYQLELVVREY